MRFVLAATVLTLSTASAKPLPKALTIALKGQDLFATRDGVTVPLRDPDALIDVAHI